MFKFINSIIDSFNILNDIDNCSYNDSKYACLNNNFCKWCNISHINKCYNINNCLINQSDVRMCEYNIKLQYCNFQSLLNIIVFIVFISCMFYILSIGLIRLLGIKCKPTILTSLFIIPALVLLSINSILVIYYSFSVVFTCIIIMLLVCIINVYIN